MKLNSPTFNLQVSIFKEGKQYVAYAYALDLSTSGATLQQVKERFLEAANLFFEELVRKGTLDEALLELGWQKSRKAWLPPVQVSNEMETFAISA